MGPDVHPDPGRRYVAGVVCAAGYLVLALCAGALLGLAGTFPAPLLYLLAGLALLGPVLGGVQHALAEPRWREGALLTLACTAAGFSLLGIGGAVWGLGLGWGSAALGEWVRRRRERPDAGRSDAS
jgi:benzoate membrane transport protein